MSLKPIGPGLLIRDDPANPVVFAQRYEANPTLPQSVQVHFASGASIIVADDSADVLWSWLTQGTSPVDDDAKPPATGTAYTPAGDGVLIDRPGTARACVLYAENKDTFTVEFPSPAYPVNVFVLGADPRRKWTLMVNGETRPFAPNDVGYWQGWFPASDRYLISLFVSSREGNA